MAGEAAVAKKDEETRIVDIRIGDKTRTFDVDDPKLPKWAGEAALGSGGYPYDKKMDKDDYKETLEKLQIELVKVQFWLLETGQRVISVFEGRDAAGKGGSIHATRAYLNPRTARIVALAKPTETERGQWYYQRYVGNFPTAGEMVLFDRSWYNRAGVEPVMGFCTDEQYEDFLNETPHFEKMVITEGIHFFKFWLDIGREMQIKRFHDRRHDPRKVWKLSQMDIAALNKWDDYSRKRDRMLKETHTERAPWTVVLSNDKRRARINIIRHMLSRLDYAGKDETVIGKTDDKVLMSGADFMA